MSVCIYVYTLYNGSTQVKPECSMSRAIQYSIVICYSEFHALAIVRHTSCLFYLKR